MCFCAKGYLISLYKLLPISLAKGTKDGLSNALTEIRRVTSQEKAIVQKVQPIVDMI
jgi:hypothetical protein